MTVKSLELARRAARSAVAIAALLFSTSIALAQDEAPPQPSEATPPADTAAPAEAPVEAAPAPTEGTAINPETLEVIPVQTGEAEAPPAGVELDTIEVTGSRIKRTDYETAQPVLVIGREDIDRTGLTSIGDLLQKLPVAGTALGTTVNNGGTGAVEVDLRNLTSARVLVLVNGHRWVNGLSSFSTSAVDLTTIPLSVIERVEVLKDGASAIYGSDAIAGVINIITRRDFEGSELHSQVGQYSAGDGMIQSHSLSLGNVVDKNSLFLDLSFTRQNAIYNSARRLTMEPTYGTGNSRGSGGTPQGHFQFVPTPQTASGLTAVDPDSCAAAPLCDVTVIDGGTGANFSEFRHFDAVTDPYNYAPVNYLVTPNERTGVFAQFSRELTSDVAFHSELLYNLRRSSQEIAPMPIIMGDLAFPPFNTVFVSVSNPYNFLGQDIGKGASGPLTPGSGLARNRSLLYGNRQFIEDVDTLRSGFSLDGTQDLSGFNIDRLVNWDLGYSYAESKQKQTTKGLFDMVRLAQAVGPGTGCVAPCVPFNMFGANITPDMLDFVTYTGVGSTRAIRRDIYLNFSTELFQFFDHGPVGAAIGVERREELYNNQPDPLVAAGTSSNNRAKPTGGGYNVNEYYAELELPLLKDLTFDDIGFSSLQGVPLAQTLDLSLAGRSSDYGRFGTAKTGKAGLRWKPYDDLLVRSTYSSAFRAPNLGELYLGNSDSFPGIVDWCDPSYLAGQNATDNCQTDGVSPSYVQLSGQLLQVLSGNPNLKAETAHTLTGGVVYSPEFAPDLNIYVDWYRISASQFISIKDAQGIFDHCYLSDPSERYDCQYIKRNSTSGVVEEISTPFLNLARLETEGVDFTFDWALPTPTYGAFKLQFDSTYLIAYDQYNPLTAGAEILDENFTAGRHATLGAAFPRFKANVALDWKMADWSASYSVRYISRMTEACVDGLAPSLRDLGLCSKPDPLVAVDDATTPSVDESDPDTSENVLKAMMYHSIQVGYLFPESGMQVTLGVNNLLDTDPPASFATSTIYTFEPTQYDIPGSRFPYVRLSKTF